LTYTERILQLLQKRWRDDKYHRRFIGKLSREDVEEIDSETLIKVYPFVEQYRLDEGIGATEYVSNIPGRIAAYANTTRFHGCLGRIRQIEGKKKIKLTRSSGEALKAELDTGIPSDIHPITFEELCLKRPDIILRLGCELALFLKVINGPGLPAKQRQVLDAYLSGEKAKFLAKRPDITSRNFDTIVSRLINGDKLNRLVLREAEDWLETKLYLHLEGITKSELIDIIDKLKEKLPQKRRNRGR